MVASKVLMKLAFRAFKEGSKEDAHALAMLALSAEDAGNMFGGEEEKSPSILEEEAKIVTPVPQLKSEEKDEDTTSLTDVLENGNVDNASGGGTQIDDTGWSVKGAFEKANIISKELEKIGYKNLAHEIRSCLE